MTLTIQVEVNHQAEKRDDWHRVKVYIDSKTLYYEIIDWDSLCEIVMQANEDMMSSRCYIWANFSPFGYSLMYPHSGRAELEQMYFWRRILQKQEAADAVFPDP